MADGDGDGGKGGGKRNRDARSPGDLQDKDKQQKTHASCMLTEDFVVKQTVLGGMDKDLTTQTPDTQPGNTHPSTPVGTNKVITPRNIISPENLNYFSMIENLKDPVKIGQKNITVELLYSIIIGQETRLFTMEGKVATLEGKVDSLQKENEDLKLKDTSDRDSEVATDLNQVKQDLAVASEGIAKLESSLGEWETRLQNLETTPDDIESGVSQMQAGEQPNIDTRENDRVQTLQKELENHVASVNQLKGELKKAKRRNHLESEKHEMYSRRDSIKVRGVPFTRGENTNTIICQIAYDLGVQITPSDISVSHRTGHTEGNAPRPILVKFVRRDLKHQLMNNRKRAANIKCDREGNRVRIFIDEDLTSMRGRVCKKLREEKVPHYTRDGKVFIGDSDNENQYQIFDTPEDWEKMELTDSVKVELGIYPKD